jgi:hypothetical protein
MFLMFGDEADRDAVEGKKFFVYGAIFVPTNSIPALHAEIERLRANAGMSSTESLKSATTRRPNSRPSIHSRLPTTSEEVGHLLRDGYT